MRIPSLAFCLFVLSVTLAPLSAAAERPWEISLGPEKVLWIPEPVDSRLALDAEMKSAALAVDETFAGEEREALLGLAFPPEFGTGRSMISSMSLLPMTAARRAPWLTGAPGSSSISGTPRPAPSATRSSFVLPFPPGSKNNPSPSWERVRQSRGRGGSSTRKISFASWPVPGAKSAPLFVWDE